ncbi:unnamed protein product [Rotaria magnacalcarata]|uniref:Uncharacterized protein n=3 Tax=Rotaria magnacalcarata TaxID=392030 RepID=A0A817AI01_9BILA|nr:unnamed protein product [Rotaria magnacalcarata]CAF2266328.1 unnamed protein product [Rotaria magnacalcarata]
MFTSINCTVFDIPLTWDRTRFEASRNKCRQARRLVEASINAQLNKQLREVFLQKLDIEKDIHESQERLINQETKVRALYNLTDVASESLDDYFDKRMENVRVAIQEHCNAIQLILCEENEHWKEIHNAIDQNLITSEDIHRNDKVEQEIPLANIHTINEADEDEEHISQLLNNNTVTPLLTQMIRKSRLQSNRASIIEPSLRISTQNLIQSKEERFSVIIPLMSARRTLQVIDTTFVVKSEQSTMTEPNDSYHDEVVPIESMPTNDIEMAPSYSQPKPPAHLYFSPTFLQDNEELELLQPVLSTIDQNQTNIEKPKNIPRRFGQTFLLDNMNTEEVEESEDQENLRPKISEEIPMIIVSKQSIPIQQQPMEEFYQVEESHDVEDSHHAETSVHQKSMVYAKRQTRVKRTKVVPIAEPVRVTRRIIQKQPAQVDTKQRRGRKRKQSISDDTNNNTVALRKKKTIASPPKPKTNTRKTRAKKIKKAPIREPSPLPIIDRSKHYSTRFSTRSHRLNNVTLPTTQIVADEKKKSTRLRTKSMVRSRTHDVDGDDRTILSTGTNKSKTQPKTRAKSVMVTRNRRK